MMQQLRNHISETKAEAGQAIVLIALFMVGMLGMLGLAIDGGGLFFLWRDAQGAADSAVLSSAYAQCAGSDTAQIKARGYETADRNGFSNNDADHTVRVIVGNNTTGTVEERDTGNTVTEQVFIQNRLDDLAGPGNTLSPSDYIWVDILALKPSFFIQIVYDGPLSVNPSAMSYCNPGFNGADLPGAFAYGECGNQTFRFNGASVLYKGDIHSNGQIVTPGATSGLVFNGVNMTYVTGSSPSPLSRTADDKIVLVNPGQTWKATQVDVIPFSPSDFLDENDLAALYGPGGIVSNYIIANYGADYYHTSPPADNNWKGLYYLMGQTGDITFDLKNVTVHGQGTDNDDRGVTIITDTGIDVKYTTKYDGYPLEFFQPIMDTVDNRNYPGFIFVTTANGGCQKGDTDIRFFGQVGIDMEDFQTVNYTDPDIVTLGVRGVLYAPDSGIGGNASQASYRGAVIGRIIHMSMSRGYFHHDPSLIPPIPPSVNTVQSQQ